MSDSLVFKTGIYCREDGAPTVSLALFDSMHFLTQHIAESRGSMLIYAFPLDQGAELRHYFLSLPQFLSEHGHHSGMSSKRRGAYERLFFSPCALSSQLVHKHPERFFFFSILLLFTCFKCCVGAQTSVGL